MPASLAATQMVISAEWVVILVAIVSVVVYIVTIKVLTVKSVKNIEELWDKRDDLKKEITALRERVSDLEGAHRAKGCFVPRPPAK